MQAINKSQLNNLPLDLKRIKQITIKDMKI